MILMQWCPTLGRDIQYVPGCTGCREEYTVYKLKIRAAKRGGNMGSLPRAPIVRGTTNVLQGAYKFLICLGSQK